MRGLVKTLFGDWRTVACVSLTIVIATVLLTTPVRMTTGVIVPFVLLAGAGYLARN